ncbi:MAG: NARF domain-containing protein [Mucilaginibacter sp.]
MKTTKISLLCFLILFAINVFSQPVPKQQQLETRVKELETRLKQLEDYKANIDNVSKVQSESLKKYVDDQVKKGLDQVEDAKKTITWILWLGLPVTILSIGAAYWAAITKARKFVVDKIETIVEGKREEIIRLIETEAFDTKLRNNKELLVISGDEETQESLKKFMVKLKFKNVKYRIAGGFNEIPEHDLMIFNSPDGNLTQEAITDLMNRTEDEDTCYVAYTTKQLNRDPRLNFSNSRFTLYHSILSTLKFSEIAKLADQ